MSGSLTQGVHHVGLTVSELDASCEFFTDLLGWQKVGGNPEYPAIFVSDGVVMLTLWQTRETPFVTFDKNRNIGLHHLALKVGSLEALHALHARLVSANVEIEFSPELLREGPTQHMMCYEPSGNRIEFIVLLK
jgi:catechol 2,3-dioxygenase-like lactoylglutathione lyase family enzyme